MNIILFENMPENNLIPMSDERAKHITEILKLKAGNDFKMGIVNQSEGCAKITSISQNGIEFAYTSECVPFLYPVTLIVAQVRPICMKRILREAVSLGVSKLILTGSDTGEKSYMESNLYKSGEYKSYVLDGAMQSAHAGVSEILFADSVKNAIDFVKNNSSENGTFDVMNTSFLLLDNVIGAQPLSKACVKKNAVLAVGPERGWSNRERALFETAGFCPMLIGSRVLRTETASSVGIAILLSAMKLL